MQHLFFQYKMCQMGKHQHFHDEQSEYICNSILYELDDDKYNMRVQQL